jgi:thioredoxin-related protein
LRDFSKKVEVAAHIAIIVVAILLAVILVKNYLLPRNEQQANIPAPPPQAAATGNRISLPDVDWAQNRRTLVAVLSTTCRYCTESASLYQQIAAERSKRDDVKTIALFPQPVADAQQYLSRLGVTVDEIKQVEPSAVNVRGTPTLLMVDETGTVKKVWVGKLPPDKEAEVLTQLRGD